MTAIDTEQVLELLREVAAGLCETFWTMEPEVEAERMTALFQRVDGAASASIRQGLAALYPAIAWRDGELEQQFAADGRAWGAGEYWLCDAIDGALQFVRTIPNWSMSLTLVREGVPVFCAVYDAVHDEMFHAVWRGGAFRNGVAMRVNGSASHSHGLVASSQPPLVARQPHAVAQAGQSLSAMLGDVLAVRNLGPTSLQLAYVACGRLDAFWEFGQDGHNCIGPSLLVQEAGGLVTQADGARYTLASDSIAAAPPGAHASMLRRLCDVTIA
jgi:myo-inositol-1(or 4)-monophosphatase